MRFVVKPPDNITPVLGSNETYLQLLSIAKDKLKNLISETIYREPYNDPDEKRSRVEDQLALSYFGKCAYCERYCKADVEHFRPKKGVKEETNHDGYYWLCYEWTNLIPACVKCNRDGGKHNNFPILGTRVNEPSFLEDDNLDLETNKAFNDPLALEKPYLLHPEVDNPEQFLGFELDPRGDGIRIKGIDAEGRGQKTIEICSLNRQELRLERVENVIIVFKEAIESAFVKYNEIDSFTEDDLIIRIEESLESLRNYSLNEEYTHTLLRKFIIANSTNFEAIMIPYLSKGVRKVVMAGFASVFDP